MQADSPVDYYRTSRWAWWGLSLSLLGVWALGAVGFQRYEAEHFGHASWLNAIYHSLQLFILHTPHLEQSINPMLQLARFAAPAIFGFATLQAVRRAFYAEYLLFRLMFWRNHTVLCGLGAKGGELLRCYLGKGEKVVVIERDEGNPALRICQELGVPVLVGRATDPLLLAQARVSVASRVIAMCGDDGTNVEIAVRLRRLFDADENADRPLECFVQLSNVELRTSFQKNRILGDLTLPTARQVFRRLRGQRALAVEGAAH